VALPLNAIRIAYAELCRHVDVTLRVQIGDVAKLGETKLDCLRFLTTVDQVSVFHYSLCFASDFCSIAHR
jgi:hypothetical protein